MIWPAALPGAAARVMRTAAGRRALQLGLLVGALFALGFVCGEQAHAAEGVPTVTSAGTGVPSRSVDGVRGLAGDAVAHALNSPERPAAHGVPAPEAEGDHSPKGTEPNLDTANLNAAKIDTADFTTAKLNAAGFKEPSLHAPSLRTSKGNEGLPPQGSATGIRLTDPNPHTDTDTDTGAPRTVLSVVRPVAGSGVASVTGLAVRPVGDLVQVVTDGLAEARASVPAHVPALPSLPALPALPSGPGSPALPLPGLPGRCELPGRLLPAPVTSLPQRPGSAHSPSSGRKAASGQSGTTARTAVTATAGPRLAVPVGAVDVDAFAPAHRAPRAEHTPAHRSPDGDPSGAVGNLSTTDTGTSRHGDAHAVTLNDRAPLHLLPGAAARVDAAGIRDRQRDIPVFPG
ncbi:hypothetical protein [Streptomyces sp. NPDC046197]|uniref:hypothetical protein n=1 Tax=Streptomyces sp. NPDC046197 TaxID=3154337 RepID=UPI0033D28FA2